MFLRYLSYIWDRWDKVLIFTPTSSATFQRFYFWKCYYWIYNISRSFFECYFSCSEYASASVNKNKMRILSSCIASKAIMYFLYNVLISYSILFQQSLMHVYRQINLFSSIKIPFLNLDRRNKNYELIGYAHAFFF